MYFILKKRILFIKRSSNEIIGVNYDQLLRSQQHDAEVDLVGFSFEFACSEGQSFPGSQSEQLGS